MKNILKFLIVVVAINFSSNLVFGQNLKNYLEIEGKKYELNKCSVVYGDGDGYGTKLYITSASVTYDNSFHGIGIGIILNIVAKPNIEKGIYKAAEDMNAKAFNYIFGGCFIEIMMKDGTSKPYSIGNGTISISNVSATYTIDGTVDVSLLADAENPVVEKAKIHYVGTITAQ